MKERELVMCVIIVTLTMLGVRDHVNFLELKAEVVKMQLDKTESVEKGDTCD